MLRSHSRAESSRLPTAERLVRLTAVFCIPSGRVFWMAMINRAADPAPASAAFTAQERALLDELVPDLPRASILGPRRLSRRITKVTRLRSYHARAKDPPPGNIVIWRGLSRLTDIATGFQIVKDVGN